MALIEERLRTERLLLERPRTEHAAGLAAVLAEPALGGWLWPGNLGGPRTAEQTAAIVARDAALWDREGWGPWVLSDPGTGTVLGRAGMARNHVEGVEVVELAWLLSERRWREGLATEAAREGARAAFEGAGLDAVVAIARVDNHASQGVMRRLGMRIQREIEHAGMRHVLAELTAADWSRAPAGPPR